MSDKTKVVILAGGLGTRLAEETRVIPKPMVEIGGRPMLWHIMKIYGHYGFDEFFIALGYKGDVIKHYFVNYYNLSSNITINTGSGEISVHDQHRDDWIVHLIDTGLETMTGGRVRRLRSLLGDATFMVTYGDGVTNLNIQELLAFHRSHGKLATLTAIRPPSRFGGLAISSGQVVEFIEKPQIGEGWINGGYMVLEPDIFDYLNADEDSLEMTLLERLASEGQLMAFQHGGFWQCMDTMRDVNVLRNLWNTDQAHWKVWDLIMADSAFWRSRPTFVTGASGLVGSWLVRRLVALGADVVCLVRDWVPQSEFYRSGLDQQVRIVQGDICDQPLLERILGEYEITTVIHLAAQTIVGIANRNPISTFESNIRGTWVLLEACRRSPLVGQIVLASSDKAYGQQPDLPYTEAMPLQGEHPYDVSKSCADLIGQTYAKVYELPVAITRCGNFYGGGDLNWNRIVPGTIRSILRDEPPIIRSDGEYIRDYFYVEDGAIAYTLLAEKLAENPNLRGEAFNFSNEIQLTVLDLVNLILKHMDSTLQPDIRNEVSNEIVHQYLSAEKARNMLTWEPAFTLDDGLQHTIKWYEEFFRTNTL